MAIENLREIGNVLYEQRADGMLYPVRRIRPDIEPQGIQPERAGILDVGGIGQRLGLLNQIFNPVEAIGQSMNAGGRMMSPNMGVMDRLAALGDMASGIAGVVAPVAAASRAGTPAATALMEGLLGGSPTQQAAADMARGFVADESGALRLYQGSPHNFAAERLVRMPDGSTQYIVGRPDVLPDVPAGAELLRDFPLGRQRMDKIGTGEGAQAYGYGLYGAEAENVARGYRDTLSDPDALPLQFDGRPVNTPWNEEIRNRWPDYFSGLNQSDADAMEELLGNLSQVNNMADVPDVLGGVSSRAKALYSRIVKPKLTKPDVGAGSMYELEVNANPENFLDWDRPLSEQSQPVRDALGRLGITSAESGNEAYMRSSLQRFAVMKPDGTFGPGPDTYDEALALVGGDPSKVRRISEGSAPMRSEALRREGIPGIRYLDEKSRSKPYVVDLGYKGKPFEEGYFEPQFARSKEEAESIAREYQGKGYDANVRDIATRNYVIFDENLINIVRKYGIAGAAAMLGVSAFDVEQAMAQGQRQPQGLLSTGVQ